MGGATDYFFANIWQILEAISTLGAAALAFFALRQAGKLFEGQQKLTERLHDQEFVLAQRQMLPPLFEQLNTLSRIDPKRPIWPDVVRAVNFLDLLGICWEAQLIEEKIIFRLFRERVIEFYENIRQCKNAPESVAEDGEAMLRASRPATSLYNHLMSDHFNRDRPEPIR